MREQWQKLVEFFQFISNIIKVCQKESLSSFIECAKVGQERVLANGYFSTDFMRDVIYEQVSQANSASYVVWSIANTYVETSPNHLMSRVASLGLSWPLEAGQFEQQYLQYLSAFQQIDSQRGSHPLGIESTAFSQPAFCFFYLLFQPFFVVLLLMSGFSRAAFLFS